MRAVPIRLRLTLWYSVMFATAALLLSTTSWWMLHRTINASVHQDLQERVDDVREQLRQYGPNLSPQEAQSHFDAIYKYRDDGKWLQILDQDGRWIYRSSRMALASTSLSSPGQIRATESISEFQQGFRHVRTLSSVIAVDGRTYSVQTGISMNKSDALLQRFGMGLLLLSPSIVLVALFVGNLMSRQALAPVAAIANEARRITDRNLDSRLPVCETDDEIAHLSVTLNGMLSRLDAGFRSVRDFTANASHELRTPLARLRTEVEIALLSPRSAEDYRDTLEHIQDVAVDMTRLLEDLLILARAEAGSEVLRMLPVDLRALIETVIKEWKPVAANLSIDLRSEVTASHADHIDQPLPVLADRSALQRLLRIWLDNACKFTPPGGKILVGAVATTRSVLLSVEDSGIGIPLSHQQQIFDRFYRVQGDTTRNATGTGLGLSIAAWIAEQHKTSVELNSAPGIGSRFQIALTHVSEETRGESSDPLTVANNPIAATRDRVEFDEDSALSAGVNVTLARE